MKGVHLTRPRLHADQVHTTPDLVRRLLAAQFPHWADLPIEPVATTGTENAIYRLGAGMAVRLAYGASRPAKSEQVRKLARWLPELAPRLPLAIPEPVAVGEPTDVFPAAWLIVTWLDGEEAAFDRLAHPVQAARQLAKFVRALMAIDPTDGPAPGEHNFARGVPLEARDADTRDAIARCDGLVDVNAVTRAWEADLRSPAWDRPPVWLHGDLAPDNLLVVNGRLNAVIDWGGMAVGDPAMELLPAWNLFEGESREAYRDALGFDDATWARGRGLALSVALVALPYYLETNPVMVRRSRRVIERVLADHGR